MRARRLVESLCTVLFAAACATGGGATEPAVTETSVAETSVAEQVVTKAIRWSECEDRPDHECATLEVPVDYGDLDGATLTLGLARLPASGDRIGPLFFNPGGPGGSAVEFLSFMQERAPPAVRERFDLVAMDPRGVGRSSGLDCGGPVDELYAIDPTVEDSVDRDALLEASRSFVEDCGARHGPVLAHLGTANVARDMDAVRAAMGDQTLNYLGFSYGTSIGQLYAQLFGERVRAMVLDGVVDVAADGLDAAVAQAEGFEIALENWAEDCSARPECPLDGDPIAAVEAVIAAAEESIAAPGADRPLGPGEAALGLRGALYSPRRWDDLARAVDEAAAGDGTALVEEAHSYLDLAAFETYFAVSCLDARWPDDPDVVLRRAEAAASLAPHFGEAAVNDYLLCALWPAPADPLPPVTAPDAPPILVVATTGDPATPYGAGVAAAERLETGILLTHVGEGHTVVFRGDDCVEEAVTTYLLKLALPEPGTECR